MTGRQETQLDQITRLHMIVTLLICGAGVLLIFAGFLLIIWGNSSATEIDFGILKMKSSSVGLIVLALGIVCLTLVWSNIGKTYRDFADAKHIAQKETLPDTATAHIVLHLSEELRNLHMSFGLLHVRDGKDEISDKGPLLNQEIGLTDKDRQGTLETQVTFAKHLGFQFKCFVDFRPHDFNQVKSLLEANGFKDVSLGQGKPYRAWFILPDYPTDTTKDGFLNNYYYPN